MSQSVHNTTPLGRHYYIRQWNEVNIGGDYEIGRSVRRCVCLSVCVHELAEIIKRHSRERLLVSGL